MSFRFNDPRRIFVGRSFPRKRPFDHGRVWCLNTAFGEEALGDPLTYCRIVGTEQADAFFWDDELEDIAFSIFAVLDTVVAIPPGGLIRLFRLDPVDPVFTGPDKVDRHPLPLFQSRQNLSFSVCTPLGNIISGPEWFNA